MKTKQRSLAVLLAMVLVLGGLLWLITRSNAAEEAASSAAAEGSIVLSSFAAGDAEQIRYTYQNETITLNCDSGSWTLADDPGYHLDASACNTMVTALASLNAKRQLTAQPGEDYGLADPAVTVTVTAAGSCGEIRDEDPDTLAWMYVSPVITLLSVCDRQPEREAESLEKLDAHVKLFFRTFNIERGKK